MKKVYILLFTVIFLIIIFNVFYYIYNYDIQFENEKVWIKQDVKFEGGNIEKVITDIEFDLKYSFSYRDIEQVFSDIKEKNQVEKKIRYFLYKYNDLIYEIKVINNRGLSFTERKDDKNYFYTQYDSLKFTTVEDSFKVSYENNTKYFTLIFPFYNKEELIGNIKFTIDIVKYIQNILHTKYKREGLYTSFIDMQGEILAGNLPIGAEIGDKKLIIQDVEKGFHNSIENKLILSDKQIKLISAFYPIKVFGIKYALVFSLDYSKTIKATSSINLPVLITTILILISISIVFIIIINQNKKEKERLLKINEELLEKEKAVIDLNRILYNVLDSLDAIILASDLDSDEVLYINKFGMKSLELENIASKKFYDILQIREEDKRKPIPKTKLLTEAEKQSSAVPKWEFFNENSSKYFSVSEKAIKWFNDKYVRLLVAFDITERKKAEERAVKSMLDAESANKAKSEFIANMSHEIRTPLNAVLGFAELLKEQLSGNDLYNHYIEGIQTSGRNLLNLINDVLDISKIEAGKMDINYEPVNPYNIISDIEKIFSLKIKEKNLSFEIYIDDKLPKCILIDETRIRQVLFNLIGNAVKFTMKGGIKVSAYVEEKDHLGSKIDITFTVEDTGIGIPKDQQALIFEKFTQREGQSTRKYGGTGLGLSITKRLVELMNGEISVESEVGKGSKFIVKFKDVSVSSILSEEYSKAETEEDIKNIVFEDSTILIVEDIESNRTLLRDYLTPFKIKILEAENGEEALMITEQYKPDLILMDIQMPVMDGYETSKILREREETADIKIVAITAYSLKDDINKIRSVFDGFLRKPVSRNSLINEIKKFLPYKLLKEDSEEIVTENIIDLNNVDVSEYQYKEIKTEILPLLTNLRDGIVIEDVYNFSDKLSDYAKKYNLNTFSDIADRLKSYAQSFKIEAIENTIEMLYNFLCK
ncbi:MAG: ATP-binding protein [Ignavibacteria bacterium]|nr:ATP-binding protein [Ignavibacteria bacterium]